MNLSDIETLSRFVSAYRRRVIAGRIIRGSLATLTLFFTFLALLQLLFAFFPWTLLPLIADAAFLGTFLFLTGYAVAECTVLAPSPLRVARSIERRSAVKTHLLSLSLELARDRRTRDNPFSHEAYGRAAAGLAHYPQAPERLRHNVALIAAVCILCSWCFLNRLSPLLLDYWALPFFSFSAADAVVTPGSITVPENAAVELRLEPGSGRFPSCRCHIFSPAGERLSSVLLRPDTAGFFTCRLDSVKQTFLYRFAVGGRHLTVDTVTVAPPPRLSRLSVTVRPPSYTRRSERSLPEGQGNFEAYAGSTARITVEADRLSTAHLVHSRLPAGNKPDTAALAVQGTTASGEFPVVAPLRYTFLLTDTLGQRSDSLPVFKAGCIPDEPPFVQIIRPGFNKDLQPEQIETLYVEGADDLGVRSMALAWRTNSQGRENSGRRDLSPRGVPELARTSFIWHLTELSLYPGDTAWYWAEISDTKRQRRVSDTFTFRIPTFEEIHRQVMESESYVGKTVGAVRDRQAELQDRLEQVTKAMGGSRELTWEQRQILDDIRKEFQAQADSLRKSVATLREHLGKMKQEGSIGEELAQKFDKVREAVDDLVREYGDSLLFSMEDIEKPVSMRELRRAVERITAMLPKLDEQLDKVLKFLEMLKEDRKLAELAMRAEQLSKEQAAVSHEKDAQSTRLHQKDLLDRIEKLSRDVGAGPGGDSLQSKAAVDSLQRSMRSRPLARQTMNQMSGALLSLSQDLMQMMHFREDRRLAQERRRLLSLVRDALALVEWQEELQRQAAVSGDQAAIGRSQQALKDAIKKSRGVADSMSVLAPRDMLAVGKGFEEAVGASEKVIDALGSGPIPAARAMTASGIALRSLAGALLTALSNSDKERQSACSGGLCMMPGLRRLSGRQAAINSMTADLLSRFLRGQQGEEGGVGSAEAAREAAQKAQAAIADELKRLAGQYGKEAGEGLTDRVEKLQEEARRLAALLERPAQDITERQDRFLARMLETTLSMHREGEGKDEWKSRTAEKIFEENGQAARPGSFYKDVDLFHRLRQRAFRGNYPESYRSALRAYFEGLSEKYLK